MNIPHFESWFCGADLGPTQPHLSNNLCDSSKKKKKKLRDSYYTAIITKLP